MRFPSGMQLALATRLATLKQQLSGRGPLCLLVGLLVLGCGGGLLSGCQSASVQQPAAHSDALDPEKPIPLASREQVEAHGKKWVLSTQGIATTKIAAQVLKDGGNLVDAAVAASFAISVERPHATGLGGGGFLIYYEAKTKQAHVIDFRERSPMRTHAALFLDRKGNPVPERSTTGGPSVGVPGLVRGLAYVHKKWGSKPWASLVEPAAKLSEEGFPIYPDLAYAIALERTELDEFSASRKIFLNKNGTRRTQGELIIQEDLAKTLHSIAQNSESFYRGKIAEKIAFTARKYQGILSEADLAQYTVKEWDALRAPYQEYEVLTVPPPSLGGVAILQILKLLEKDPLEKLGFLTIDSVNLIAQAMQQAFADRSKNLSEPNLEAISVQALLDPKYLEKLRAQFTADRARKASEVIPGGSVAVVPTATPTEPNHTTHLSLMDEQGNVVVTTQTLNGFFGSKMVGEGTGVVMNNSMDDFGPRGLGPKKTPYSSMAPVIVFKEGMPILALGAEGGSHIISAIAQVVLSQLAFHKDLYTSIAAPMIHEPWMPDEIDIENFASNSLFKGMTKLGYKVKRTTPREANVMAVGRDENGLVGVADPRDIGTSAGE